MLLKAYIFGRTIVKNFISMEKAFVWFVELANVPNPPP